MVAVYSADGRFDWRADDAITKIVIGAPPSHGQDSQLIQLTAAIPSDLALRFPNLTHLHLWQIENLEELPRLPGSLQCLDVRGCPQLQRITNLPGDLDTLVLASCPELKIETDEDSRFPKLRDLALSGCPQISHAWIRSVFTNGRSLERIDISACPQIERIAAWPPDVVDIRLNRCTGLSSLPEWPHRLRRVELRNASAISRIPDFPSTADLIDLAYTRSLKRLPKKRGNPRTLILYGSGILEPPASEHGEDDRQNVAEDVRDYFQEVTLTGRGEVRRCKVMILGNGDAGKTCLAMNLVNLDYGAEKERAEAAGRSVSTHGVQFWDLHDTDFRAEIDNEQHPVHLHLWDFGGQEIYHNTHRLFISRGTVFVLVWNPDRKSVENDSFADSAEHYADEPRGLQYWVDLIRRSCDHVPRIAIVCSRRSKPTPDLELQWKQELRPQDQKLCEVYYIDSWEKTGQRTELLDWLAREVGHVIATQGTIVPKYWELAQEMVEWWVTELTRNSEFAQSHRSVDLADFGLQLQAWVNTAISSGRAGLEVLSGAITDGTFQWSEKRIVRTLSFLTRSGWIYWDASLFSGRVIVGQQWALDGLYTILDRPTGETRVYTELRKSLGRFTRSDLETWAWKDVYSQDEQELLISFMVRCGLCFRLHDANSAWRNEDVYAIYEHLLSSAELRLEHRFHSSLYDLNPQIKDLSFDLLHRNDWQLYLTDCGHRYGPGPIYAKDGIFFTTAERQTVFISCTIDRKSGFGGRITVRVSGKDARSLHEKLTAEISARFSDANMPGQKRSTPPTTVSEVPPPKSIFISYAWNSTSLDVDYEGPVDRIEQLLMMNGYRIEISRSADGDGVVRGTEQDLVLRRDKKSMGFGESLLDFMKNGARSSRVILIHSDRYWKSVNCMYELWELRQSLTRETEKSLSVTVIPIELPTSQIRNTDSLKNYLSWWTAFQKEKMPLPSRMNRVGWTRAKTVMHAKSLIADIGEDLSDLGNLNLKWEPSPEHALEQIRMRLQIPTTQVRNE